MNEFFGKHEQSVLSFWRKACIGIAGAGGLGSNIAVALVRAGVGKLVIADFDSIEITNLNRQAYFFSQIGMPKVVALEENLQKISPYTKIDIRQVKLSEGNIAATFADCQLLMEALDNAETKVLLAEVWSKHFPQRHLIMGNGVAGYGGNNKIRTISEGFLHMVGDFNSCTSYGFLPHAPKVMAIAALMANLALELMTKD